MFSCFACGGDEAQRRVSYGHTFGEQDPKLESYWQGGGDVHEGRVPDHVKAAAARAEAAVMAKFKENQTRRIAELDRQAAEYRQQQQRQQAQRRAEAPPAVGNARVSGVRPPAAPPPAAAMPAGPRAALPPRDSWQAPARVSDAPPRESGVRARVSGAGQRQPSRVAGPSRGHAVSSSSDPDTSDEEEAGESDSDDGRRAVARPSRSRSVRDSTPSSPLGSYNIDDDVLAETRRVEAAIMAKFAANKAAREAKAA